jgi:hypothetical protein
MTTGAPDERMLARPDTVETTTGPLRHAHRWRGAFFYLRDAHPWLRMTCGCGAERDIRAWERYWQPGAVTDA